ncbi:MAG: ATP-dependent helicase/nuclease subunit [Sphingomonadales bacterium]|nr:ATP-dependent helicase/nuclease subunit [Sphingomonadales bacterium]
MAHRLNPLTPLEAEQERASSPRDHAALSASAGTGKTHVLTARVLRLLLSGVEPSSILCLTFTKAGAAEMAGRIQARLAYWVRLEDNSLRKELFALGEPTDDEIVRRARTLFARVLDAADGGLRIQTIHAFAQGLLAAFPAEAGLTPGFRPLEGREEQMLARQALSDLLVAAEAGGDEGLIADAQALSHRLGEAGAEAFLRACARAPEGMAALGAPELVEDRLRTAFGLPPGDIDAAIAEQCGDELFDLAALRRVGLLNRGWGTKNGLERASLCEQWAEAAPAERARLLDKLHMVWARSDGQMRSFGKGQAPPDEDYAHLAAAAFDCCGRLLAMGRTAALVACLAAGLRAGQRFAEAYAAAKRAAGVVDFDDLIRWTEGLLGRAGMGEWVRYKLDQATDHILVDEAQDTNAAQWSIIGALSEEFFSGAGAVRRHRTLFTVGDYKQAIFGFQGTDPKAFETARQYFEAKARNVRDAAIELDVGERELPPEFLDLSMDRSFRSSPPVLRAVDAVIRHLGHEAFGLPRPPNPHLAEHARRAGGVTLWRPFTDEADTVPEEEAGEEGWVSDTVRAYAARLARQVRAWLGNPFMLEGKKRPVRPEDILILVRRRGDLAALIVARLHAEGVPVAGVDRLLLTAPLAVRDLLAAIRFAVQPLDDLNLASLLVSPLFGWDQDHLFAAAYGRDGASLWPRVRDSGDPAAEGLSALLAMADYATPHQFLETILSGPLGGRRKLLERLGPEASDPIEELLASALQFDAAPPASLQRFLDWFARGDVEVVRDPSAPLDAVRVMTVHGSKGLQSPVVVLADACADPERARPGSRLVSLRLGAEGPSVPAFRPRRDELVEPLLSQVEALERREREEHWRLLYVAMTRAEERLYVGGALGAADRQGPSERSWYAAVEAALAGLGAERRDDAAWGSALSFGDGELLRKAAARAVDRPVAEPAWLRAPAPVEARPPRPLAPSAPREDDLAEPPPSPAMRAAAERGRLLHQLFERLPAIPAEERAAKADRWLERGAGIADAALRAELVANACGLIADPRYADLFGPAALAEAPVAAVVGDGIVVSGTVDRLLVEADRILLAEFKTARRAPATLDDVPVPHLRQLAYYVEALRTIFPGRRIEAKLLYTAVPRLFDVPGALLDRYRPGMEVETEAAAS